MSAIIISLFLGLYHYSIASWISWHISTTLGSYKIGAVVDSIKKSLAFVIAGGMKLRLDIVEQSNKEVLFLFYATMRHLVRTSGFRIYVGLQQLII